MKKIVLSLLSLLSLTLSMSAAVDGKFTFTYPDVDSIPYNLGYQYPKVDLDSPDLIGWEMMTLTNPVTLTYHITSEDEKTVEVVFDPSYMEIMDIVIPEKVMDGNTEYTVTAIGKMAFDDCPEIRSVIMPNSITRIEDYAFNMCENKKLHHLGYVKFSKNLTHIGNYAFKNCHNLTTGYFKEGDQKELSARNYLEDPTVPTYGYGGRCTGLDDYLLLPASVEYIGKHAFEGCYFEPEDKVLGYGLCKVKIPNPSCVIDDYAFAGCEFLELVTIGEELNYNGLKNPTPTTDKKGRIGDYAFANCNLMRLDIPSSIESIGDCAFINCFKKETAKTKGSKDGRIYFKDMLWFYPRSLFNNEDSAWNNWYNETGNDTHDQEITRYDNYLNRWHTNTVTIYSDNTKIGNNAFANNPKLKTVKILESAVDFGSGTFRNCPEIFTVELPADLTKIGSSMFMNCSALKSITIPENVTEIGDSAFYMCEKLTTLELPSNLTKVNPYTFYGCKELSLSTLPGEVSSIGNHAFFGCREIKTFTIPYNVTTIGEYAFANCYRHDEIVNPDYSKDPSLSKMIYAYGLTQVKIGDGVQTIGAHAFYGCRHLGTIEMGKNITEIGDYAFQNCMSCPEVDCDVANNELKLPDSLTKLGTGAFQGCIYLPGITLGNAMTELPDFAFAYCSNLSYIENIDKIKSAKDNTFLGCCNLKNFGNLYADKGKLEDGIIYNDNFTEVISALPNITEAKLLETVTKIHEGAFANCGALQSVSFPESLKEIGPRAFSNCVELQKLVFPASLEEIGSRAFENCTSLQSADLINVKMGEFVYAGCTGIETVTIAEDFTQDLQDNWFAGCINMSAIAVTGDNKRYSSYNNQFLLNKEEDTLLRAPSGMEYLILPESVTKIGDYACSNCIYLTDVEIPSWVTHIGAHAFDGCYYEEVANNGNSWGLTNVYLTNPAVTIDEYAFNNCKLLTEIYWEGEAEPGVMGSIGAFAFNNCENLEITTECLISAVIDSLKPYAFANFPGIVNIELPETLESIGDHAFENCQNLTSVVFPTSLKSIGNSAFKSSGLTAIDLPNTIEEIGDSAFMNCNKVMALTLPSDLKTIKPYTFYKCFAEGEIESKPEDNALFNLKIKIPDSVESIGDYAFYGCSVNSRKYHAPDRDAGFKSTYSDLYYVYNYGVASVSIGNGVKSIGNHAFDGCIHLVDVTMGEAVTTIGDYAFNNCFSDNFNGVKDLEITLNGQIVENSKYNRVLWQLEDYTPQALSLPSNLKTLGEGAFNGCVELPSINFPASLEAIPALAFNGCCNLPEINLPEGLRTIGDGAFGGCTGVKEIHIPASFENGSRVFVDCENALKVYYYAEKPLALDEGFFSAKVYSNKESWITAKNAPIMDLKMTTPWALFHTIEAKDQTLVHNETDLAPTNGLRFRILSNIPHPYCEVAGPEDPEASEYYEIPEKVHNNVNNVDYTVIRIGNDAFENNQKLKNISIPSTVFDIGIEAFNNCRNLEKIKLPESITNLGERAFAGCYGLTYFEVPPLVTRLNTEVLKDCRGLYSIRMHDNITELGAGSLMDCRHLRAFERSEDWKLKLIDDYALKNCIELEKINIPEGVEKIGKEAMYYCQKLLNVSLPTTLKEIGENVFDDCERLTIIRVYTEKTPKMLGAANLTEPECKIFVQAKTLDAYRTLWAVHQNRIQPGIRVTSNTNVAPQYYPGATHKFDWEMPLVLPLDDEEHAIDKWTSSNNTVASPADNDGMFNLNAVGPTDIKVKTTQRFYHDGHIDVYPQDGDANWDGAIDVSDAVNIANYTVENRNILDNYWNTNRKDLMEDVWNKFYYAGSDLNKDGEISFADASAVVAKVLGKNLSQSPGATRSMRNVASDDNSDALLLFAVEGKSVMVGLDDSREYVALEAFIRVPEGMMLKNVVAGHRADAHSLSTRRIDDRTMRVVLFDLNNSAFAASRESLIELLVDGDMSKADDIEIFEIVASDISSCSHNLTTRAGGLYTSVHSISDADKYIKSSKEGLIISGAAGMHIAVYALDGYEITSFVAASESETISLQQGVYIVTVGENSSKVAVK